MCEWCITAWNMPWTNKIIIVYCLHFHSFHLSLSLTLFRCSLLCLSLLICTAVCCFSSTFTIFNCNIFLLNFIAVIKVIIIVDCALPRRSPHQSYRSTDVIPFGRMKCEWKKSTQQTAVPPSGRTSSTSNMAFLPFHSNSMPNKQKTVE